jgi:DNA-binding Xre family transcriptional regulator
VVKIGQSDNPLRRLDQLQTGAFKQLILIKVIKTIDGQAEAIIHSYFARHKTTSNNEWYRLNKKVNSFISKLDETLIYSAKEIKHFLMDPEIKFSKFPTRQTRIINLHNVQEKKEFPDLRVHPETIQRELKRLNWTQTALAKKAQITKQGLSVILKRKTARIETLNRIGEALGIDPRDLLK